MQQHRTIPITCGAPVALPRFYSTHRGSFNHATQQKYMVCAHFFLSNGPLVGHLFLNRLYRLIITRTHKLPMQPNLYV